MQYFFVAIKKIKYSFTYKENSNFSFRFYKNMLKARKRLPTSKVKRKSFKSIHKISRTISQKLFVPKKFSEPLSSL